MTSWVWARFRIGSHTMPGQQHSQPTPPLLGQGVYLLQCNLPHALLAGWPGPFTCHCSNMGVERTLSKSQHRNLTPEKRFCCCSYQESNPQLFHHESIAPPTELSPNKSKTAVVILESTNKSTLFSLTNLPIIAVITPSTNKTCCSLCPRARNSKNCSQVLGTCTSWNLRAPLNFY